MIATRTLESDNLEIPAPTLPAKPGLIYSRMAKIMAEVGAVSKGRRNPQQGYQYRGIEDLYAALQQKMAEHGVFSVPRVLDVKREERATRDGRGSLTYTLLTVEYTFFAEDGSSVRAVTVGEGMDSSDKSANKAMSVSDKYALIMAFKIPTAEMRDPEADHPQPAPRQQPAPQQQPARRPGPAPVVAPPPFVKLVRSKLEDRGLRGGEVDRAVREIAASFEVSDLAVLGREDQARVLRGIAQGAADKYREPATAH